VKRKIIISEKWIIRIENLGGKICFELRQKSLTTLQFEWTLFENVGFFRTQKAVKIENFPFSS
jgi:hypothetical protein